MTRTLVVAAAIVDDPGSPQHLLAARRSRPPELAGQWEFPGGKVEPGEAPTDALHRELREELGITAHLGREIVGPHDDGWHITDRHTMRLWFARITGGVPRPLVEHDELRWLPRDGWRSVPWLAGDWPIIAELLDLTATQH